MKSKKHKIVCMLHISLDLELKRNSWYRIDPVILQEGQIPCLNIVAYVSHCKTAVEPSSPHYSTNMKSAALKLWFGCEVEEK